MPLLGVNIDHVATLRQLRGTKFPEPVVAASICELAGVHSITVHLREDRRHIQDRDVKLLRETLQTRLNLEMAVTEEMVGIACDLRPNSVCLVPEKRQEVTTEGGLDVISLFKAVKNAVGRLNEKGIQVSLFIDPDQKQIEASKKTGAQMVEIHTGSYCNHPEELNQILSSIQYAKELNLICNAGHGLDTINIQPLAKHPDIHEFNIGHSIICRAVLVGLDQAVREMLALLR
ncbi:MAG: pyridoxine 5'-phosphate synthase [Deltaproteobacteria bacterium]|nr:pyridoxine 5'-phosphate synthase [Deltaproteobacteria bacterium]MBI3017583.1 pyridoxine 5'-phosphate synthase [Deltaproteobacteria bacterium]